MEQLTAYLIMIFFPVIPWFLKLTISYKIRYKIPKLNVEKFYKKSKTSFIKKYFYMDLKKRISPLIFYSNFSIGCLLLLSVLLSLVYLCLAIFKYTLSIFFIPYTAMYATIVLVSVLLVFGIAEIIEDRTPKK